MSYVDEMLKRTFSQLSQEGKTEVKRLGSHQPYDFTLVQQDKKTKWKLQSLRFKMCE